MIIPKIIAEKYGQLNGIVFDNEKYNYDLNFYTSLSFKFLFV